MRTVAGNIYAASPSAKVECTNNQQIIAERPMYFNYHGEWTGGHDVVGFSPYFTVGSAHRQT